MTIYHEHSCRDNLSTRHLVCRLVAIPCSSSLESLGTPLLESSNAKTTISLSVRSPMTRLLAPKKLRLLLN